MRIGKLQESQLISSYEVIGDVINVTIFIGERWVSNPTLEQMAEIGYKPMNESSKPICPDGYYLEESYIETENEILVSYTIVENPTFGGGLPI
jgi:hypothetical protein